MKPKTPRLLAFAMFIAAASPAAEPWIRSEAQTGDLPLVAANVTPVIWSSAEPKVLNVAASALAADIQAVTGKKPALVTAPDNSRSPLIAIGIVPAAGDTSALAQLAAVGKVNLDELRGKWETFSITAFSDPQSGRPVILILGSDRRGAAFGAFELSQAIGVSPWVWWADVTPARKDSLFVAAGARKFGPPSVQYRGIFINDEDWGLQPWAAKTFEPESGDIGPKTYAKMFELMLRLKANTVWPGMHPSTKPFNFFPANKQVADDYAIVMGSSHAEPMLRNNVGEWSQPAAQYNYVANRDGVLAYWEERVKENGKFENIYTLGMRGIHDSNMQGPRTDPERIRVLEQIFADQRALLKKYVGTDVGQVPQMFCAYKEVLALYRQSLQVPEDVTIVWPDDNFGYIRNFTSARERGRSGGFGVYYHISYLGRPLMYLWLNTTPPALIWKEMYQAYEHGARRIWIANVGDLKPAEIGMDFFLQMAWDINQWTPETLPDFLPQWAAQQFGPEHAEKIGAILTEYYQLNFQRKPEHLQWWLQGQQRMASPLTPAEAAARLSAFSKLCAQANEVREALPRALQDAYFELVWYPVRGSALVNERYFFNERYLAQADRISPAALSLAASVHRAQAELNELTRQYNQDIAGGKWNRLMNVEIARGQWTSMRSAPFEFPPEPPAGTAPAPTPATPAPADYALGEAIAFEAEDFSAKTDTSGARWVAVPGLGRTGSGAVTVLPTTTPSIEAENAAAQAPHLEYKLDFPRAGQFNFNAYLLPTHPIVTANGLRFAVALDDAPPQLVESNVRDESAQWAQGVLNNTQVAAGTINVPSPGPHTLKIYMVDAGVALDKLVIDLGGSLRPSYLGPPAVAVAKQ